MISLTSPRLVRIGLDTIKELPDVLAALGARRPLFVVDPHFESSEVVARLRAEVGANGGSVEAFHGVVPDPTTASVDRGVAAARAHAADAVVGFGGGSAIDTAKAVALLVVHAVPLRTLRAPRRVIERGLPVVAVPTTAGTGSEATRFCLVTDSETGDKMVCIGEGFVPAAAIIDARLTLTAPFRVTADTGIDAFTHALEAYVGVKANPVSDLYAAEALRLIARALPAVLDDPAAEAPRADMMLGAFLAGAAFSNSGLALAHAMSAPLGAAFNVPHGLSIALLLPEVTRFSLARAPRPYARVARLLGLGGDADDRGAASTFMSWLDDLVGRLRAPTLSGLGVDPTAYEAAVDAMALETPRSGAAANNPAPAGPDDVAALFRAVWA